MKPHPTRSALVTGASRGIGLGIATRLATLGYGLTITARHRDQLAEAVTTLEQAGATDVVVVSADMADPTTPSQLLDAHSLRFGDTLDTLIVNAGVGTAGSIGDVAARRFDKTVDVNLRAAFCLIQQSLPLLRHAATAHPQQGAKVIAMASITGVYAEAGLGAYGATKAALLSLIETLNVEESAHGVTATAIAPAYVDTDMSAWVNDQVPADTMIRVDDLVELVDGLLRLSSRAVVNNVVVSRAGTSGYCA